MNIYFLLEGRSTEKKVYGAWLKYLLPEFQRVKSYNDAQDHNYFLISAHGYPSIIHEYIPDAINRIKETGQYQYLVVCLDADEDTVESKKQEIFNFIEESQIELDPIKLIPIIQNRCIETWFLGNCKMFDSRQKNINIPLSEYVSYYDVSIQEPELMGHYNEDYNHAEFHAAYLKEIFKAKNSSYSKKYPRDAQREYYLRELITRIEKQSHLKSLKEFIVFCEFIRSQL
ncbi:hypothetical protein J0895_04565 [Phormidium pseudopriestleyi FRX01]|uniref:DUF4276 family protein n=1 Tax=Phormidium pseudopriestleyi FRX01 TaxID=1759528 RepID=A0ABS3FMR1_9CYAN|nr:hypothetical protein [Phormidium pseudopriestleyi]MBO0348389.1 hypothetical protein [Phormidium pseudopriestleyi FRX01]